jgi:hypothetical protein
VRLNACAATLTKVFILLDATRKTSARYHQSQSSYFDRDSLACGVALTLSNPGTARSCVESSRAIQSTAPCTTVVDKTEPRLTAMGRSLTAVSGGTALHSSALPSNLHGESVLLHHDLVTAADVYCTVLT